MYFTATERPEELTAEERFRFQSLLTLAFSNFELALEYYRDGLLGDEMIEGYEQGIRPLFENPVVVEWWGLIRSTRRLWRIAREEGKTLIEAPLTLGVVSAVLLPVWAAIGAIAALVADCTIVVEKVEE